MPKGGKKPTPPPALSEGGSPQSSPPPSPSVPMDVQALLQWMADREEAARAEREEQRREDAARFEALLTRLAPMSLQPSGAAGSPAAPSGPPAAPPTPKAADEEVVQRIIALDAAATLADVVTLCRSYEATRTAASALRAPPGVRAVSQYRKDKKTDHRTKADARPAVPTLQSSCSNCGKQQHGPKGCPATEAVCHGCGKTGHWSHMEKCPAKTVQCNACSRYGHFEKLCKSSNPKSQHSSKPKLQKTKKNSRATIHVVRTQSPLSRVPETSKQEASNVRRVHSTVRVKPTPSPTICIVVTHGERSNTMEMIPDTGADTTVIGPQHLQHLGLTSRNLQPPPSLDYYNADGSKMPAALGSLQAELTYGKLSCSGWIDVQGALSTPLLSWQHCRELGIIPKDFPRQITDDVSTVGRIRESTSATPVATVQCHRQPASVVAPLPAPSPSLPLHANTSLAEAKEYFLQEYADVLVKKDDLQKAPLQPMSGSPMRIHLREDAKPFAVHTPRLIPRAYQDHVKAELDSMVAQVSNPTIDDDALDAETSFSVRSIVTLGAVESLATTATDSDPAMEELRRAAHEDPAYVELLQHIKQGFPSDRYALPNTLRPYWKLLRVQDPTTKRWDKVGTVMGIGKSRDYLVKMPSGRIWWRNRRFLRPSMSPSKDLPPTDATPPGAESPQPALPRRSARIKGRRDAQDTVCYEREGGREM
ncbi:hypothetical protein O3P69_005935 [Scylla paramamosain]|uniref:CCHC-type domain-containing protein n=1 Tax=Scylla paramamosain TaxID=85552 RepID=A0AAW0U5K1_SCYPA